MAVEFCDPDDPDDDAACPVIPCEQAVMAGPVPAWHAHDSGCDGGSGGESGGVEDANITVTPMTVTAGTTVTFTLSWDSNITIESASLLGSGGGGTVSQAGDNSAQVTFTIGLEALGCLPNGMDVQYSYLEEDGSETTADETTEVCIDAPSPVITTVDPSEFTAGASGTMTIRGSYLSGASVSFSGTGLTQTDGVWANGDTVISFSYSSDGGASGARTITVTTAGGSATATVTIDPNPISMKFTFLKTEISTDGNYSEDSTIQVTAVDSNHNPITTFTGAVNIAEDGTSIYSQNGGCLVYVQNACSTSSSVTISSGGTTTFLARSLAGPKTEGQNGAPPGAALLKATNYGVDGGTPLAVKQWIVSNTQIDPLASDKSSTYGWFQYRIKDIVKKATGDLATVLGTISGYTLDGTIDTGGQTNGQWGVGRSPVVFNPYITAFRLDSAGYSVCELPTPAHWLTFYLYHEARHGYQFFLWSPANDEDNDYLVNSIPIAPSDVYIDTTDPRTVCDEMKNAPQKLAFKGKLNFDAFGNVKESVPGVGFALEMDANKFASQH
jgi:hypothetical protein